jgi:hypothetical protein
LPPGSKVAAISVRSRRPGSSVAPATHIAVYRGAPEQDPRRSQPVAARSSSLSSAAPLAGRSSPSPMSHPPPPQPPPTAASAPLLPAVPHGAPPGRPLTHHSRLPRGAPPLAVLLPQRCGRLEQPQQKINPAVMLLMPFDVATSRDRRW